VVVRVATQGLWLIQKKHIHELELFAIQCSSKAFATLVQRRHVNMLSDNTTISIPYRHKVMEL
jgi:hypothetical protein